MTPRLVERPPRKDRSAGPSPKHPFDRDPLLIPQLFVDGPPWYQRRETIAKIVSSVAVVILVAGVVRYYSVEGVLRTLAKIAPS
ncbi:MAG: hypothetical protein ABIP93_14190 [Gemmatimonadaceae bacterium]